MKYKCLILDHDDTIVDSTRTVNFPAFLDSLSKLRPLFPYNLNLLLSHNRKQPQFDFHAYINTSYLYL